MAGAYQGLAHEQVPDASSATRVLQQVGGSFGTAVLAVILASQASAHAGHGPAGLAGYLLGGGRVQLTFGLTPM